MLKIFKANCIFIILLMVSSGCASLTGYQDGRSIGDGNVEISPSLNVSQSPDFVEVEDSIFNDLPTFRFPNIELATRFGVSEKLDITARLNTNLNLGIGTKYQLVGDRSSKYALGIGLEMGTFGLLSGLWNIQLAAYGSIHPNETITFYLSPKYINQFSTFGEGGLQGLNYVGGNFGILVGRRHKFGLDIGLYNAGSSNVNRLNLSTVGIGGKFFIGDNSPSSETEIKARTTRKTRK
jgi:hypothetical protein